MTKKILAVLTMLVMLAPVMVLASESHGHHGGGHHGGRGGYGGGAGTSASVSAPAASPSDSGAYTSVSASGEGKGREQVHADSRSCDAFGDITVISKQDGSFTYSGLEFQLPTFVQCMKDKGYALSSAGRNDLTNFGAR